MPNRVDEVPVTGEVPCMRGSSGITVVALIVDALDDEASAREWSPPRRVLLSDDGRGSPIIPRPCAAPDSWPLNSAHLLDLS